MAKYVSITVLLAIAAFGVAWGIDQAGWLAGANGWVEERMRDLGILRAQAVEVRELPWIMGALGSLFIAWVSVDAAKLRHPAGILAGTVLLLASLSPTMAMHDVWYPPLFALSAAASSYLGGLAYAASAAGRRKRKASQLLGKRVRGKGFWGSVREGGPVFEPSAREVTAVVCQFLNRGEIRASLTPRDVVRLQDEFVRLCRAALLDRGAVVGSPRPGSVVGWFGCFDRVADPSAPEDDEGGGGDDPAGTGADESPDGSAVSHALAGVSAGFALSEKLATWRNGLERKFGESPCPGIAIASGPVTVGVFDGEIGDRFGVFGELEDTGVRVCAANAVYGSRVLLTPRTRQLAASGIEVRPMEMLYDPAAHGLIEIYELLALKGGMSGEDAARRDRFWEGMGHFRKREWKQAIERFEAAETGENTDYPLEYFLSCARKELASSSKRDSRSPGHARPLGTL